MSDTAVCPACGILYESTTESACSPERADRLCPVCYRLEGHTDYPLPPDALGWRGIALAMLETAPEGKRNILARMIGQKG